MALILSSAEAGTPLCAMPRMLRLAGMTGTVGRSERPPGRVSHEQPQQRRKVAERRRESARVLVLRHGDCVEADRRRLRRHELQVLQRSEGRRPEALPAAQPHRSRRMCLRQRPSCLPREAVSRVSVCRRRRGVGGVHSRPAEREGGDQEDNAGLLAGDRGEAHPARAADTEALGPPKPH